MIVPITGFNLQRWTHPNNEKHSKGDAFVQVPVLNCHSDHQSTHKQHVSVLQVLHTHLENQIRALAF